MGHVETSIENETHGTRACNESLDCKKIKIK